MYQNFKKPNGRKQHLNNSELGLHSQPSEPSGIATACTSSVQQNNLTNVGAATGRKTPAQSSKPGSFGSQPSQKSSGNANQGPSPPNNSAKPRSSNASQGHTARLPAKSSRNQNNQINRNSQVVITQSSGGAPLPSSHRLGKNQNQQNAPQNSNGSRQSINGNNQGQVENRQNKSAADKNPGKQNNSLYCQQQRQTKNAH